ncbi:baseplate multidomain protein megatron [Chelativorans salis]|uniref:Glycoside hydrolase/phage tail family protein n=1 Tax=Chelativorans salis TaxID=2978478 RepID=A0ABT2LNF7_9HYPH|nr:glycoside hydrolase/phage tail family protein [Chelativorans sp. EGI FJ00035]MCT7376058.1 glycoside hydrolase/phage tail family protein [Chelativorans sp. EGI FJ00035]
MATIVLQAAGAFLGGALGPVGSAIGSAAGAMAGYMIDRAIIDSTKRYEGPRLSTARPLTAEEGAPLPQVYGTARVGGTLIWATRFEERRTERQGGKGGPKVTTYSYFANAAFALCEGEIAGVRRIWADGQELDRDRVEIRVYPGSQDQPVDLLIEAKQGAGNAPAYRGTAYLVIERFPIDDYGRRIPQFQFEVMRPVDRLNRRVRSVSLIPGATEYGLSPTLVKQTGDPGETRAVNRHNRAAATDFEAALDELQALCPNLESVSLVVAWFGTNLNAGHCTIRPMVTQANPEGLSQRWRVSGIDREEAQLVSQGDGQASYGGTPTDTSVMEAIAAIRQRGLRVGLYPFIMMDVPAGNDLPDPYGGAEQAAYPWRGRITCHPAPGQPGTADKTALARAQIGGLAGLAAPGQFSPAEDTVRFSGDADEWSYRRLVLHYAHLAAAAGGVDAFLLGSEMRGLTTVRDGENRFPFVEILEQLAGQVRGILGAAATITYAADWSEYFGYQPADGSGDTFFHLDSLWAHPDVDAVGIDNYMPLSDWQDSDVGGGNPDGFAGPYDLEGLRAAITSGEGFDWYYASQADRAARLRSSISDAAYGKDWVFRYKDLAGWWSNQHFNRVGGVEAAEPTAWVPQSKPFHFTEVGCAAVDKGTNQPNVFPDRKSSENTLPYFSNGGRSDLAQQRFLAAHYAHWEDGGAAANPISAVYGGPMVDVSAISLWAWDARPFPAFPTYTDVWGDGENWAHGHWLNGRLSGVSVAALIEAILADHGLPAADTARADGTVAGYVVTDPTTARAAIEPVATLFGISAQDGEEGLVFATEGAGAGEALLLDELVVEEERETVERVRTPDHTLPALVQLDFRNPLNDHQSATAAADYVGAKGNGTSFVSFPGVLSADEANGLVRDLLRRSWDGRERVAFSVPLTEQRLEVGSVFRLPDAPQGPEYLATEIEDGLARLVRARRIVRVAAAPATGAGIPERDEAGESFAPSRPHAVFLDLPVRTSEDAPQDQLRLAARAKPWRSQAVLVSPEETGFALRSTLSLRAVIGTLVETLSGGAAEGRSDRAAAVTVRLYDGELQSLSRRQVLNGGNTAAVRSLAGGWEILQFDTAEEIALSVWRLTGLLRGQLGTNDAMAAGAANGAPFVLLDEAVAPAGLKAGEIGLDLNWRVGPAGFDPSEENFVLERVAGGKRALLPLSPVHLKGRIERGDLALSWQRRGRIDADGWLGADIPLGETQEHYRVEIAPVGGAAVRSVDTDSAQWTYTAAMAAADFAESPPAVDVTVRQVSTAIGAGIPVRRTVAMA